MKRYFLFLALLLSMPLASARSLVLHLTDGTQVYYVITSSDYPHMVLQADGSLTCNGERYAVANVKSFRLSTTDYAGADGTRQGASDILVLQSDTLFGQGDVRVCDMEGRVVVQGKGEACLAALPAGVYVVSQGSKTVKICKR